MFDGVGLGGRTCRRGSGAPWRSGVRPCRGSASMPGRRRQRSRRPARAGRGRRAPRWRSPVPGSARSAIAACSSVMPLNVLPTMTNPPSLPRAPRCRFDSHPVRRPCPHSIGDDDEVQRVDRLHLAPRPATPAGVVRRGEVLHHHSLVATGHRGIEEALRFVRVSGDDRGQPRDARHGRRQQLPTYRQRFGDNGVAADVEDVEEERRQSGATTRRVGAEVTHRVLEAPRRSVVEHAEHLTVEHEVTARQRANEIDDAVAGGRSHR